MAYEFRVTEVRQCQACGQAFRPWKCAVKAGKGHTCSKRCAQIARAPGVTAHGKRSGRYIHGFYVNNKEARHVLKAHNLVKEALKYGRLIKAPCERCGTTEKVEAHHDDYDKPLEVRWLCFTHHREHHRFISRRLKGQVQ